MSAEQFKIKRANFATVFPSVAGPAIGGYAGYNLGKRLGHPEFGALLGTLSMGTAGKLLSEQASPAPSAVPPGAPYNLDATDRDIPSWALQGAQMLQPQLKQSAHESPMDVVMGEVPGYTPIKDAITQGPMQGLKSLGGTIGGGIPGGLIGTGLAHGVEHLVGRQVRVPGLNMSLSDLLGSVGGAIGATKGLRYMQS
jgi:hypothetical protein